MLLVLARTSPEDLPGVLQSMHDRWRTALWQEAVQPFGVGILHCAPRRRRYLERETERWLVAAGLHPDCGPLTAMGVPAELVPPVIAALARITPWTRTRADMRRLRDLRDLLTARRSAAGLVVLEEQARALGLTVSTLLLEAGPFYAAALEELQVVERQLSAANDGTRRRGPMSSLAAHWDVVVGVYRILGGCPTLQRGHRRAVLDRTGQVIEWALGGQMFSEWPGLHQVGSLARGAQPELACQLAGRRGARCRLESWLPPARPGTPESRRPRAQWLPPASCPERRERLRQLLKNNNRRRTPCFSR